jgi:hypothetical protein
MVGGGGKLASKTGDIIVGAVVGMDVKVCVKEGVLVERRLAVGVLVKRWLVVRVQEDKTVKRIAIAI